MLLQIPPYIKDVAALPCETAMFQKSHKFRNTLFVFMNEILLKLSNNLNFCQKSAQKKYQSTISLYEILHT